MMKKLLNLCGIIASLAFIAVFFVGVKELLRKEYVFVEVDSDIYHKYEVCDKAESCFKKTDLDAYNDTSLTMCPYCYSQFDRKNREEFVRKIKDKYSSVNK